VKPTVFWHVTPCSPVDVSDVSEKHTSSSESKNRSKPSKQGGKFVSYTENDLSILFELKD
jgi:hypothetical protein